MSHYKEDAEYLRFGLVVGVESVDSVVSWADEVIATKVGTDPGILELSLVGNRSSAEVVTLLHNVAGRADSERVMRRLCWAMFLKLKTKPELGGRIARVLYQLMCNGDLSEEGFGWEAYAFSDGYCLPHEGGPCSQCYVHEDLLLYLKRNSIVAENMD